jgi:hypothetical protein
MLEMGASLEDYKSKTAKVSGYLSAGADLLGAGGGGSSGGGSSGAGSYIGAE